MSDAILDAVITRLGVELTDRETLLAALTHPSYSSEHGGDDYERLEFLGDAVIACAMATHLYSAFPDVPEGDLTLMKVAAVRGKTLAQMARELELGEAIRLGRGAAKERGRDSVLENAFEAVVGAISLELGIDAACRFFLRVLGDRLDPKALLATTSDPKNLLQELVQQQGLGLPEYEITGQEGPAHQRTFTAVVRVRGEVVGSGSGESKQQAQRGAAAAALEAYEAR